MIQEAVMALGEFKEKPDQSVLYEDISELMSKYGSLDMGEIDVAEVMMDLMEVMKENKIRMPHGLTMLARGLTNMEGVLCRHCSTDQYDRDRIQTYFREYVERSDWKKN